MPSLNEEPPRAAYVHIPFCRRRCFYCDFPISVVGDRHRGETSQSIQQYVDWLCQEIAVTPHLGQPLHTLFLGGGTPSLLSAAQIEQLLAALTQQFGWAPSPEISMEMDPGTFTLTHAQDYRQAGINRVSLGAQAFQDDLLTVCGRTHQVADIYRAYDLLQQAGFQNLSLDLISGLPTQTLDQWEASLDEAIALQPQHLSAYDLVLEPGTVFGKRLQLGEAPLPTDDLTAMFYRTASQRLQAAGYVHYEISNYAQPGFDCRHNLTYWANAAYYGFGMGAASYTQGQRFSRPRTRSTYRAWLEGYLANSGQIGEPMVPRSDRLFETFMLGLRRTQGVSVAAIEQRFGVPLRRVLERSLQPFQAKGWIQWLPNGHLALSDPEGLLFSNQVLVALWETLAVCLPE